MPILKHFCKYPGCTKIAGATWSLVPVCFEHHKLISVEIFQYYERGLNPKEREHYNKIRHLTPWGKKENRGGVHA